MIYFSSDLHFSHHNIISYCKRPYGNTSEMNAALIRNWNNVVKEEDEVYILGDICFDNKAIDYISQLLGKKYIIRGNHDKTKNLNQLIDSGIIEWWKDYYELNYNDRKFVLCHYPFESWNNQRRGSIHLHGHIHSKKPKTRINRIDVGVDAWNYKPISIDEIINYARKG